MHGCVCHLANVSFDDAALLRLGFMQAEATVYFFYVCLVSMTQAVDRELRTSPLDFSLSVSQNSLSIFTFNTDNSPASPIPQVRTSTHPTLLQFQNTPLRITLTSFAPRISVTPGPLSPLGGGGL